MSGYVVGTQEWVRVGLSRFWFWSRQSLLLYSLGLPSLTSRVLRVCVGVSSSCGALPSQYTHRAGARGLEPLVLLVGFNSISLISGSSATPIHVGFVLHRLLCARSHGSGGWVGVLSHLRRSLPRQGSDVGVGLEVGVGVYFLFFRQKGSGVGFWVSAVSRCWVGVQRRGRGSGRGVGGRRSVVEAGVGVRRRGRHRVGLGSVVEVGYGVGVSEKGSGGRVGVGLEVGVGVP